MPNSNIIIYGTTWCWDCRRARRFLNKNQVTYEWIDIDKDQEAEAYVKRVNQGNRSVPTIIFADDSILVEPSNDQLAEKLRGLNG